MTFKLVTRKQIEDVLNSVSIDWRWGGSESHYNVFPKSNIDASAIPDLKSACVKEGWTVIEETVMSSGKYFDKMKTNGFRIVTWKAE